MGWRKTQSLIQQNKSNSRRKHYGWIISLSIVDFRTQQVLVDNGSSVDILYYPTFQQMRVNWERHQLSDVLFVGFGGT